MITKASEEYLKTMYVLKKQNGNIRVTDIANKMNCTKPSVNKALNNLKEEKLVTTDETINKLAKYVHNVLGLKELNCNYDINQEKCRCCVKRAKTKKSNDMQN